MGERKVEVSLKSHGLECQVVQGDELLLGAADAISIGAADIGEEIGLILTIRHEGESYGAVLPLDLWNRFTHSIQFALLDAGSLELARRERLGLGPTEKGQANDG